MTDIAEIEAEIVPETYPENAPIDEQRKAWIFTWWSVHGFSMKDTLRDCEDTRKWLIDGTLPDEKKPKLTAVK